MSLAVHAQGGMEKVLQQVEKNNTALRTLLAEQEASLLDIKASNAVAGPTVEYSPFYKKGYSGVAESELVVSEEIEFPTKYSDRKRQHSLQQGVNEAQYNKVRRETLLGARQLCIDVIRLNKIQKMLQERLRNSQRILSMYEKRIEAGDANALEVNKVKLDVMEVQTLVAQNVNERSALMMELQKLNGGEAVELPDTVFPAMPVITSYEEFRRRYLANDVYIKETEARMKSSAHEVAMSRREWLPNISVGYRRNTEMGEAVNGVLVGVSFPVLGNGSRVKAARKRQESAALQLAQSRQDAEALIKSRYEEIRTLLSILDHSDVAMMQQTLQLLSIALQHGEITALQYYAEANGIYEKLQRHIEVHSSILQKAP